MNTSQFMDKQIMDLANSPNGSDFINLVNPQDDGIGSERKEEITPSYDFQPIRPIGSSPPETSTDADIGGARAWNSADSKNNIGIRNVSSLDSIGPAKTILDKGHNAASNEVLLSAIDQTMKKYADNVLQTLEGVSSRISQLESRSRHLENAMDDLKISVENNQGSSDGKLRQLENILREVQSSVQVVKDKQDVIESQLHLAKLQVSKTEQHSEIQNTNQSDSFQHASSVPHQSYQPHSTPPTLQPPSAVSQPNPPPPASHQNPPPPVQFPNQFVPNQVNPMPPREPYFPPPSQMQESTNQQYQLPPPQQPQPQPAPPLPAPPQQHYQAPPHPQYSQPPAPQPQQHPSVPSLNAPQQHPSVPSLNSPGHHPSVPSFNSPQTSLGHRPEEPPYPPAHSFPPSVHQSSHPTTGNSPSQQFYGAPSHMYEPPSSRINSGLFPSAYGPSSGSNEPYPPYGGSHQYGGPPSLSSSGSMKQQGGGSAYPQLPTARVLPQGPPTASAIGGSGSTGGGGNRVPIDDVVDKVTTMGFSRDQVRATVRKLTESGQTVDLNTVLDKLMNEGGDGQPPRGWFGR